MPSFVAKVLTFAKFSALWLSGGFFFAKISRKSSLFREDFCKLTREGAFQPEISLTHHLLSRFSARLLPNTEMVLTLLDSLTRRASGCFCWPHKLSGFARIVGH
jgi:hypothetical protein